MFRFLNRYLQLYVVLDYNLYNGLSTGCPDPGYYGFDCAKRCPGTNCRYCHIVTGDCLSCNPGYQGQECKLGIVIFLYFLFFDGHMYCYRYVWLY